MIFSYVNRTEVMPDHFNAEVNTSRSARSKAYPTEEEALGSIYESEGLLALSEDFTTKVSSDR